MATVAARVGAKALMVGKKVAMNPMAQGMAMDAMMSSQGPAPGPYVQEPVYSPSPHTSGMGKLFNLLSTVRWFVVCMVVIIVVAWYASLWTTVLSWIP